MVISVHGDISSKALGIRRPSALSLRHSTSARLPPAESPATVTFPAPYPWYIR